jgi:hypothetical protein
MSYGMFSQSGRRENAMFLTTFIVTNHDGQCDRPFALLYMFLNSGVPRNFVRLGVQQIQLRTEGRENGDLGAAAP